jgi:hypothetical protein
MTKRGASWLRPLFLCALLGGGSALAQETAHAQPPEDRAGPPQSALPETIVDLQPYRQSTSIQARFGGDRSGMATLVDLDPWIHAWYLLTIEVADGAGRSDYHLENPFPERQSLRLDSAYPFGIRIDTASGSANCDLWGAEPMALKAARRTAKPYASLCGGMLYLRNPAIGKATRLEQATDFLREHVWGGERIVNFVRREFFQDAYLEKGTTQSVANGPGTVPTLADAPPAASLDPAYASAALLPEHLDIALDAPAGKLLLGRWYAAKGLSGIYVSAIKPEAIASAILNERKGPVNRLDAVESGAVDYLVAFDLAQFDLGFAVGTIHPKVEWSEHVLPAVRDDALAGPDGIGTIAPLVANGMVAPWLAGRTVGTFTGGFKRQHGAFQYGAFAHRNRGSHYGFIEQGTVMSRLVPGLSTLIVLEDGSVVMKTWGAEDEALLPRIKDARQNGVPLIEVDDATGRSVPGSLVSRWGPGNWSGSPNEKARTLRAGACLQENDSRRFLIYGYFSDATPSAMARVFQAYGCRYAMHLDMNALEHTYLALYVRRGDQVEVEHLIDGMSEVDEKTPRGLVPRFLGVPDDRDFFYVTRRAQPR